MRSGLAYEMMEELVGVVNVGRMDVWIGKQLFGREE